MCHVQAFPCSVPEKFQYSFQYNIAVLPFLWSWPWCALTMVVQLVRFTLWLITIDQVFLASHRHMGGEPVWSWNLYYDKRWSVTPKQRGWWSNCHGTLVSLVRGGAWIVALLHSLSVSPLTFAVKRCVAGAYLKWWNWTGVSACLQNWKSRVLC